MNEPIAFALATFGKELDFGTFCILGIPELKSIRLIDEFNSAYQTKVKETSFKIDMTITLRYDISLGSPFSMQDECFIYYFRVLRVPEPDLTGWGNLPCEYLKRSAAP